MRVNKMKKGLCFLRAMMTPMDIVGAETVEDTANDYQLIIDCKHPELVMTLQNSSKPAERLMSYQADRIIEKLRDNGLTEGDCSLDSEARKFVVKISGEKISREKWREIADCLRDKLSIDATYPGLTWAMETADKVDYSWTQMCTFIREFEIYDGPRWSLQKEGSVIRVDHGIAYHTFELYGDVSKSLRDLLSLQSIPAGSKEELSSKQMSDILDFCTQQSFRRKMSAETSTIAFMEKFVKFLKTWETPVTLEKVVDYEKAFYDVERAPNGYEPCLCLGHHYDATQDDCVLLGYYLILRFYKTAGDPREVSARQHPHQTSPYIACPILPLPHLPVEAFHNKHYNLNRMMLAESVSGNRYSCFLTKEQASDLFEMVKSYLTSASMTKQINSVAQSLSTTSLSR